MSLEKELCLRFLDCYATFCAMIFSVKYTERNKAGNAAFLAVSWATWDLLPTLLVQKAASFACKNAKISKYSWKTMIKNRDIFYNELKKECEVELSNLSNAFEKGEVLSACNFLLKMSDQHLSQMHLSTHLANGIYLNRVREILFLITKIDPTINLDKQFCHLVKQLDHDDIFLRLFAPEVNSDTLLKLMALPLVLIDIVISYCRPTREEIDRRLLTWSDFT